MEQSTTPPAAQRSGRTPAASRRRQRTQEILAATRALFDERGLGDAQIEDIARSVGINRAIVYRHFSGKEELFALTLVGYLDELRTALSLADDASAVPAVRLQRLVEAFADYGLAHPAFVDCAQTLMRRTGPELLDEVSEEAALRLGRAMASCLGILTKVLVAGGASGDFHVTNPPALANLLYATGLGTLQLARVGLLVEEDASGAPQIRTIAGATAKDYLVRSAVALATAPVTA
ncbi:TetR/AcrR family transcriptional regulator [Nocardioides jishulii]|uniref:TetR/AcrR family transcriptional regulator n=1 Tax=Nocardioides jishulii TaxID=2575440 RepID=A0A4V5TK56_9ACTN|nr:TetR/AcrR family transcriptional regulator [Nocardioides jishulii]QCX27456.1 TetR/AcrR family transcriptional regulator [Nocardioides jishulii]TKI62263.1 TetR/AcrR family transcriptional regulator [Nocardioides jishulii]